MPGALNIFQRTMLQWNDLHPYNAVHLVRIDEALDLKRLGDVLSATLAGKGLGVFSLDRSNGTYAYHDDTIPPQIRVIAANTESFPDVAEEIRSELNAPFNYDQRFSPFRFFVVPELGAFSLGLVYFHPIADAESVVFLLRDLMRAYLRKPEPEQAARLDLYPERRGRLLRCPPGVIARRLLALPAQLRTIRQSHRPRFRDVGDMGNGFGMFTLGPEHLNSLVATGKAWQVTINDLLLALQMKSVSILAPAQNRSGRRRKITAGCIVNLRRELGIESAQSFGLFLGSFTVSHEVPAEGKTSDVATDICRQTGAIKRQRLYLGTPMELRVAALALRFFSPKQRRKFYQKYYPLWCGLTNMNLNSLWGPPGEAGPADYLRAVSTGPATPLVFSVTTVRERINIGLSYRTTVFSPEDIARVKNEFMNQLLQLPKAA